jgi:ATP-dependent RNA helicase RhlE
MPSEKLSFESLKLTRQFLNATDDMGYEEPTLIQQKAIPLAMAGHDVLGIAQTGTGKTAAFVLPILMKLKYAQGKNPRALVLAPTRELVMQIEENAKALAKYTDLRVVALYGGLGPSDQIAAMEAGVDIVIATPRRFLDIYKKQAFRANEIKTMVLDEADKMMDMGFMHQIESVLEVIPTKRQNFLFSATMPTKVIRLTDDFLEYPQKVEVTPEVVTVEAIEQCLYKVLNAKTKLNLLEHLLQDIRLVRVMVFVKTKTSADNIGKYLERKELGPVRIVHANKGQHSRINAVNDFKDGDVRVLVSTDITSRGMDISMVSHVINYDVPLIYEDYVHRIGRTGRAKNSGVAITFANEVEMVHIPKIEALIRQPIPVADFPEEVLVEKTPFAEMQLIAREIDLMKKKADPDFQGAFHEKKKKFSTKQKPKASDKRKGKGKKR